MAPVITTFSGPLNAVTINKWLISCDEAFKSQTTLSDEDKIKQAGKQISPDGVTQDLAEWWRDNDEIETWAAFKDGIKIEALGGNWRTRALEAFYSTKQEGTSVSQYIETLEANRSVIAEGVAGSKLKPIDEFTFKCHMVFNAAPGIVAKLMKENFDVVNTSGKEVKRKLLRVAQESGSGTSIAKAPTRTSGYLLLDAWGIKSGTYFTSIGSLPFLAKDLGSTNTISIWSNNQQAKYMISQIQFEFDGPLTTSILPGHHNSATRQLGLGDGEYVASITITGTQYRYYHSNGVHYGSSCVSLSSMLVKTSATPPRSISLGGNPASADKDQPPVESTFKAPSGWRIVGFHGHYNAYNDWDISGNTRYPVVGLGVILAPTLT